MHRTVSFFLFLAIGITFFATFTHSITAITQDLGRHILIGKIILQTQSVPKINLFSYTYPNFPFINHHWLSEVFFYLAYHAFGFSGTFFLTFLSISSAFLLIIFFAKKKANVLAIAVVSFLSLGILFERTDVRPESFSMLFFSLFLITLFTNREKSTKWIYALIPLELFWTNMHVYFPIGYITVGLFFLDALISITCRPEFISGPFSHSIKVTKMLKQVQHNKYIKQLFTLFIFSAFTTFFNPNGLSGALYPFHVFANYGYTIQENQTVFFLWSYAYNQTIVFFWITVLLLFITLLLRFKYTRPIDWLLAMCFTILATQAIRNFPLFVFAIFFPFTYHLSSLTSYLQKNQKTYLMTTGVLFLFFVWQFSYVTSRRPISITVPKAASSGVDFLIKNHIHGPFFNNFDIGSYVIFRLYPQEKVFIDGRPEAYPASFFQQTYIPMQENQKLFEEVANKYHFNAIFFSHTDQTPWGIQFMQDIIKNPSWKFVYLDDTVAIFLKNTQKNKYLPKLDLTTYQPTSETIQGLFQLLVYFQNTNDPQNMSKTAQKILEKDPNNCVALQVLLSFSKQSPFFSPFATRYQQACH